MNARCGWLQQGTHFSLFLHRVQSNYVMMPEGRVHYYEAESRVPGGGIPLVLVHGLADRDESWAPMLERLKRSGFHVYAPDLLGYGRSPKPADSDYSISTQEQFVADFIQAIGLQKPNVGGWSMGGWIVLKLALDHPEMVDRVVIYDSAGIRHQVGGGAEIFHPTNGPELQHLADLLEPHAKPMPQFVLRDALRTLGEGQWVVDSSMASMEAGKDLLDTRLGGLDRAAADCVGKRRPAAAAVGWSADAWAGSTLGAGYSCRAAGTWRRRPVRTVRRR